MRARLAQLRQAVSETSSAMQSNGEDEEEIPAQANVSSLRPEGIAAIRGVLKRVPLDSPRRLTGDALAAALKHQNR